MIENQIPWGEIGYIVFKRTYSRRLEDNNINSDTEEFEDVINRELNAIDNQLNLKLSDDEITLYKSTRLALKWSVAGRFMWQLGTKTVDELGLTSLQNCFSRKTKFVTSKGIKSFEDFNKGDKVIVKGYTAWKEATIQSFGKQKIYELILKRHSGKEEIIETTKNHRWIINYNSNKKRSIKETIDLQPGMILQQTSLKTNLHNLKMCKVGIQHGLVFGDGHYNSNSKCCAFVPCGDSVEEYKSFFNDYSNTKEITGLPYNWKQLPSFEYNKHYIYGFLAGWFAADGSVDKDGTLYLSNKSKEVLEYAKGMLTLLDIYSNEINLSRDINPFDGSESTLYRMSIRKDNICSDFLLLKKHKIRWKKSKNKILYKVIEIRETNREEEVWCLQEPDKEEFTLSNGILTKNCAGVIVDHPIRPFTWVMELLMLGCGTGYNIQKEYVYQLPKLKSKIEIKRLDTKDADFILSDTREGWVKLLGKVLKAHFYSGKGFTYSTQLIRSKGAPIKGFGGVSSGPEELCKGIEQIHLILNNRSEQKLRPIDCLDIMNIIGSIVVAGNVRRSAQLAVGDYDDIEFLKAKRWSLGNIPNWRAMSNNSVACSNTSKLPNEFWETYEDGEPYGLINLELSRKVGRLGETQYPDKDVVIFNPCAEQSLHNYETCCLSEIFLPNIESYDELIDVLKLTYKVNKHSLAIKCNIEETEQIVHKNMRMGIGMTGILQANEEQLSWLDSAYKFLRKYDKEYSKANNFPKSIKLTTVKPSGSLSLLAGVTPGIHPNPAGPYYIRRVRMAANSSLVFTCKAHGYPVEYQTNFDGSEDKGTVVVSFPCKVPETTPIAANYSWKEQLEMVKKIQTEWSDNSVSCTIYYKKEDINDIKEYLKDNYTNSFKTLSFLLYHGHGFIQAPYETITKEKYDEMIQYCKPIDKIVVNESDFNIDDCEGGACPIK